MGSFGESSIIKRFLKSVASFPSNLALVCTHQPWGTYGLDSGKSQGDPYLRLTYNGLYQGVQRLSAALAGHGIKSGSPLFLFCPNRVEYVLSTISAYYSDLVHVPISPDSLSNIGDVEHMLTLVREYEKPETAVVIANDAGVAGALDPIVKRLGTDCLKVVIDGTLDGWIPFETLMVSTSIEKPCPLSVPSDREPTARSVFFTSGTTSRPKGCLTKPGRWMDALETSLSIGSVEPGEAVAVTVPNNHAFGYICLMLPLLRGATIVFAGSKFSPHLVLETLRRERCAYAAMVPSMAHSLLQTQQGMDCRPEYLKGLLFAGSVVTPETLRQCQIMMGVATIENFYGMTEGVFCCTGPIGNVEFITREHDVSIGKPVTGAQVRICYSGEKSTVPTGTPGELHFSGCTLVEGYMKGENEDFYEDDGRIWFVTGDRAYVDSDNRLFIVGRYKDLIIRGGENLSPAKIEAVLAEVPDLRALEPQVVAAPDPIAGEVPVTVIRGTADELLIKKLQAVIRSQLGNIYVPREILPVKALGLDDYPRTGIGKIQKVKLAEKVAQLYRSRKQADEDDTELNSSSLEKTVVGTWARVLGLQPDQIDINSSISRWADSLVQLGARDKIRKATGRRVPLSKWLSVDCIADQIHLLKQVPADVPQSVRKPVLNYREGPPDVHEIVHVNAEPEALDTTKAAIGSVIAGFGLSWDSVQDVAPCTDFIQILSKHRVIDTWKLCTSIQTHNADVKQLRSALEVALFNNPLVLSFLVGDDSLLGPELGLYVTMRQTREILDKCIMDYGTVDTVEDVRKIARHYPFKDHSMLPGPLFRALIVFVRETKSAAAIMNISHYVVDATYFGFFTEDIDRALDGRPLNAYVPFKTWADSYYTLRTSPMARLAVKYHVSHLKSLRDHKNVLWPHPADQSTMPPEHADMNGYTITYSAPDFLRLRDKYPGLSSPIILKAALALFVVYNTNHTHALFLNLEANRTRFPFIPESYSALGDFEDFPVSGATFTGVLNLIPYQPNENAIEYLSRVKEYQVNLTKHACVPWHEVFRELDCSAEEVLPAVAESLIFNWMPGLGEAASGQNLHSNINMSEVYFQPRLMMSVNAGAFGPDGSEIAVLLHGVLPNMSTAWANSTAEQIKKISLWLAAPESWSKPVERFTECLE